MQSRPLLLEENEETAWVRKRDREVTTIGARDGRSWPYSLVCKSRQIGMGETACTELKKEGRCWASTTSRLERE